MQMSDKNTKTVFRFFLAWNDGKEEAWLRAQARQGLHLESVGGLFYRFRKGEPADVTYRLDLQTAGKFDKAEYLGLFRDAGWEHVCRFGAWYYFRTPTGTGTPPEIHTDAASRAAKYQRLILFLMIVSLPLLNSLLGPLRLRSGGWLWTAFRGLQAVVLVFLLYGVIRLARLVSKLKKSGRGAEKG
jgi:hypothetical protein